MCTLLGFVVVVHGHSKKRDFRARILVANYTSPMDRLAVELVFPCIMVTHFFMLWIHAYVTIFHSNLMGFPSVFPVAGYNDHNS